MYHHHSLSPAETSARNRVREHRAAYHTAFERKVWSKIIAESRAVTESERELEAVIDSARRARRERYRMAHANTRAA